MPSSLRLLAVGYPRHPLSFTNRTGEPHQWSCFLHWPDKFIFLIGYSPLSRNVLVFSQWTHARAPERSDCPSMTAKHQSTQIWGLQNRDRSPPSHKHLWQRSSSSAVTTSGAEESLPGLARHIIEHQPRPSTQDRNYPPPPPPALSASLYISPSWVSGYSLLSRDLLESYTQETLTRALDGFECLSTTAEYPAQEHIKGGTQSPPHSKEGGNHSVTLCLATGTAEPLPGPRWTHDSATAKAPAPENRTAPAHQPTPDRVCKL
jgi:hypothetical protein